MPLTLELLHDLPSPFYRVAVKALIFDSQQRLLVVFNEDNEAELPGGGWEHDETLQECIRREIQEEVGGVVQHISGILFAFQSVSDHGWHVLRLVVRVELEDHDLQAGDAMTGHRFVTKEEFQTLPFDVTDAPIATYTEQIWAA